MDEDALLRDFRVSLQSDNELAVAVAAIKALTGTIKRSQATTMMGIQKELAQSVQKLKEENNTISLISGAELFLRFVTRTASDVADFKRCKHRLIERGERFLSESIKSRERVAKLFVERFIRAEMKILVHSMSRVVLSVLEEASRQGKRVSVILTESRTCGVSYGWQMYRRCLERKLQIPISICLDSSVASIMGDVDAVLVGAEGVVENGGIINTIGTYQVATIAKTLKKPFYVVAESFKFVRQYPISQDDIAQTTHPNEEHMLKGEMERNEMSEEQQEQATVHRLTHDFTPPSFISLLFTDLGVLTPAAVSDELIKLYY